MTRQEQDHLFESHGFTRRSFFQGVAIFLGANALPYAISGCQSESQLPDALEDRAETISRLLETWSPPHDVIQLGEEVIKVTGQINELMLTLLDELSEQPKDVFETPKRLGAQLKILHLKAAREHSWVEVRAWRLTSVEAAIYALCSFKLPK
jgi:hypothetical protein